ncbi:citrinin biosynthesis oxidoreductase [Colletotrichum kahawae]|uniref:Citrinin biosynthesis oxidoreductase n=1 Tax=Colletotrichum kahawae TaxID=34407 RepID=A0AAD9Y5L7_COLKA|nr:citrinin biosynthesis oxidoreductase [Colletotrichum kahawae]
MQSRIRILCLHGDGTNATIFAAQTRHLRRALDLQGIDLVYVTGPFECAPGYGVSPFFDDCGPFYRWSPDFYEEDNESQSCDIDERLARGRGIIDALDDLRYEFGDGIDSNIDRDGKHTFAGILGFSSSAGVVAGILAEQESEQTVTPVWLHFNFGILLNGTGMPLPLSELSNISHTASITTPTVAVVGTNDRWQAESRRLIGCFKDDAITLFEFNNEHKVPAEQTQVEQISKAICKLARVTA